MAPEQARGKPIDKRADIWAFGVLLHEMVTGRRLFQGQDLTETLAAVVMREPDLADAPEKIRRLLRRCWLVTDWQETALWEIGSGAQAPAKKAKKKWRRRELNPRPKKFTAKRLRAFPVRYFWSAP